MSEEKPESWVPDQKSMGDHPGAQDKSSRTTQKRVPLEAEVNLQISPHQENLDTNAVAEVSLNCDFRESNDIYDGEVSLGTKPGVPAEYEPSCVHEAQLQAKDASLQEALNEVAKLKTCNSALEAVLIDIRKHCYDAEEKVRKKSQELSTAEGMIIDSNAQIDTLERHVTDLKMALSEAVEELDNKHNELLVSNARYVNDCKAAEKFWGIYSELGADLFYRMTYLEVIVANGYGRFFFEAQDLELKTRAAKYLPLGEACKAMQADLSKSSKEENENDDLPEDEEAADGTLRLAIEAPPAINEIADSTSFVTSEIEQCPQFTSEETSAVEDLGYLESVTPEVPILETNKRSDSEASLLSPSAQSNSEEGRPESATSNDPEPVSSMCENSGADSIYGSEAEGTSTAESRGLRWLLGYNPNPEESFYPQYLQGGSMVGSSQMQVVHEVPSEGSPKTESPGLQSLLGFNAHPEEPFYPQLPQHDEVKDTDSTNMTVSAENDNLTPLMGYNPASEEPVDFQEPENPSRAKEWPLSTYNEPAMGLDLAWLLGYNPEPEEAFYPQYSQHHEYEGNSIFPAHIEQDQEQTSATMPVIAPIFEAKPENNTTATTLADSAPLAVDVSFADTSKSFKEEIVVHLGHEDTISTEPIELEQQGTTNKTHEAPPMFTGQIEHSAPAATTSAHENPPVDISFGNTSQPFIAGAKVRMTRAQRREAAIKAQAEAMASKKKVDDRVVDDEGGRYGRKESRQERRAAERKALKSGSKQSKRNIWRL